MPLPYHFVPSKISGKAEKCSFVVFFCFSPQPSSVVNPSCFFLRFLFADAGPINMTWFELKKCMPDQSQSVHLGFSLRLNNPLRASLTVLVAPWRRMGDGWEDPAGFPPPRCFLDSARGQGNQEECISVHVVCVFVFIL